jgi:hypothetical protein
MSYTPEHAERIRTSIEAEIDRIGLADYLGFVAEVCGEKAEHIRQNWSEDTGLAHEWESHRTRLMNMIQEVNV